MVAIRLPWRNSATSGLRATKATLRAALTGDYRQEHLFGLRQAHAGYQFVMQQIAEVDAQLAAMLAALSAAPAPMEESGRPKPKQSRAPVPRTAGNPCTTRGV